MVLVAAILQTDSKNWSYCLNVYNTKLKTFCKMLLPTELLEPLCRGAVGI